MLKRHQVLLEDWQVEYMKAIAKFYDISLSESLRMLISLGTLNIVNMVNPEYKMGVSLKEIEQGIKRFGTPSSTRDKKFTDLSQLYFEARKAADYRINKLKTKSK
ncbi:MAG: hypothetical protein PHJ00_07280 [Candidatus Omnitrophica bacterium]|jgi:hypothetical protein|nr:hypothetical protein [Candidatus Omnitrophota bacterium]MDD5654736.1 hypothetical protein [Candidatus Omnitrophota bacterium]